MQQYHYVKKSQRVYILRHSSCLVVFDSVMDWSSRPNLRSSCYQMFCKKVVIRNFTKFTGKLRCSCLFLIKLQLRFPVNFRNYKKIFLNKLWCLLVWKFCKNGAFKIFSKIHRKKRRPNEVCFLIRLRTVGLQLCQKKTPDGYFPLNFRTCLK